MKLVPRYTRKKHTRKHRP